MRTKRVVLVISLLELSQGVLLVELIEVALLVVIAGLARGVRERIGARLAVGEGSLPGVVHPKEKSPDQSRPVRTWIQKLK